MGVVLRIHGCLAAVVLLSGCMDAAGWVSGAARAGAEAVTSEELESRLRRAVSEAGADGTFPRPQASEERLRLGEALMWDAELSGRRDVACMSCHGKLSVAGFPEPFTLASGDLVSVRNVQGYTDFHLYTTAFFWDAKVEVVDGAIVTPLGDRLPADVEDAAHAAFLLGGLMRSEMLGPAGNGNELATAANLGTEAVWDAIMARLLAIPEYRSLFAEAFPDAGEVFTYVHAARAMADYALVRLQRRASPWDRWLAGDAEVLSDEGKRGALLFYGPAGCAGCHAGPAFSDDRWHNLAVPQFGPGGFPSGNYDRGRGLLTGDPADDWAFRTPPLRNVALSSPYMHNGAFVSLRDAILHHLDPVGSLKDYGVDDLPPRPHSPSVNPFYEEAALLLDGFEVHHASMLSTLDEALLQPPSLDDADIDALMTFLASLSAPDFQTWNRFIPESTPSGRVGAL